MKTSMTGNCGAWDPDRKQAVASRILGGALHNGPTGVRVRLWGDGVVRVNYVSVVSPTMFGQDNGQFLAPASFSRPGRTFTRAARTCRAWILIKSGCEMIT